MTRTSNASLQSKRILQCERWYQCSSAILDFETDRELGRAKKWLTGQNRGGGASTLSFSSAFNFWSPRLIPSTDVIQLTLNLKMTAARVVETSVTVNNSPIQDYVHPDDHTQPTFEMTPGFKSFTAFKFVAAINVPGSELSLPGKSNASD